MNVSLTSITLVTLQFTSIILLIILTPLQTINSLSLAFLISGILIGIWSIITMTPSTLRITPEVSNQAKLITNGPYRFIRHPMYTSVLTFCLGLLIANITTPKYIIYIILTITLILKIRYEEKLLTKHFKNYTIYQQNTQHLIPFIY